MTASLVVETVHDPDGNRPELALKGDWLFASLTDGAHTGRGEASHSGDDAACGEAIVRYAGTLPELASIDLDRLREWHDEVDATVGDMVDATAVSALDQAVHDLVARRNEMPVWRLYRNQPARAGVPPYATINRALTSRDEEGYLSVIRRGLDAGWTSFKCAPFEAVRPGAEQVAEAEDGLDRLAAVRRAFPDLDLRVDLHERFAPESFLRILPRLDDLGLTWLEAPCRLGPVYEDIREAARTPIAAGELDFGLEPFAKILDRGWADVILPDVKHVGGIGPLLAVCELAHAAGVEVSPHNPSGPVATAATLQAAAVADGVVSVELAMRSDAPLAQLDGGLLAISDDPGLGLAQGLGAGS